MRYPKLSNWATITEPEYGNLIITNELTGKTYHADPRTLYNIYHLDGKTDPGDVFSPYPVAPEILSEFSSLGLIRSSRVFRWGASFYLTVWVPKKRQSDSRLLKIINSLLWILFLPILICGFASFILNIESLSFDGFTLAGFIGGIAAGVILGLILHEVGHVIAAFATGGKVYEMGFSFNLPFFPGAYSISTDNESASRLQKAQSMAAGLEINCIITGIALAVMALSGHLSGFLTGLALSNLSLLFNALLFMDGNDGCRILSSLWGLDTSVTDAARIMLFKKEKRQTLLKSGCCGKASFCSYCLAFLLQAAGVISIVLFLAATVFVIFF